jgi:N-methylhydantoinase B
VKKFDSVLVEVMKNELTSIGEEMGIAMHRTARSLIAREGSDFSTALVDAEGRLIAQGLTIGIHLGYIKGVMREVLAKFGGNLRPGDIVVSNDPYWGMSHLPDIVLVAPIFWRGQLVAFSTIVAHHTDIGGRFAGGMGIACAELYEEGLRLPGVKLYEEGRPNHELLETIAANVRVPEDVIGDLQAQAVACRQGERGVQQVLDRYGLATFESCNEYLRRYSEQMIRKGIAAIPDGEYLYEEFFEDDGFGGPGVRLKLTLKVHGDSVTADFTGCDPQVRSAINVPFTLTCASTYVAFRSALGADAPANQGLFAPIEVVAPAGCVVNPRFPAAVGARGMMLWRIIDMVFGALAQATPDKVYAAGDGGPSMVWGVWDSDPNEAPDVAFFGGGSSGWGGRPDRDGVDGVNAMAIGGAAQSAPAEMVERELPVLLEGVGFVPDTGGAGKYRGSLSVYRRYRFLKNGRVSLRMCRTESLPYGLCGGRDGTPARAVLFSNGNQIELPRRMLIETEVRAGDVLLYVHPGAGGYGDPMDRDPDRVLQDVLDRKFSPAYAERVYGVAVDLANGTVRKDRTVELRRSHC